ncbi:MAG: NADH-quinone oxidoreductase subunit M [Hydrogenibacillus sp.]|nr:NADH-quinone oxidoreductase subunit M [Hydrogenibacillus sp.]
MPEVFPLLAAFVLTPVIGMLVVAFVPSREGGLLKTIGWVIPAVAFVFAAYAYAHFNIQSAEPQMKASWPLFSFTFPLYDPSINAFTFTDVSVPVALAVDGLSLPLVLMTALVTFMSALAVQSETRRLKAFFLFLFLLSVGMNGVFLAQNLIVFFVFFELTLVALYFLTAIFGGFGREKAATAFLVMNGLGSLVMLFVFVVLFQLTGTWEMRGIAEKLPLAAIDPTLKRTLFWLLVIALGVKLPIFPLHTWMLKVHREAPPAVVMLHSGVLLKIGAYGLIRFVLGFFPDLMPQYAPALALLGLVNLLYGGFAAFVQPDLRRVFAYASLSHMGIVLFGVAALNTYGLMGAVFQMVSHGLISALLFLLLGMIERRTGTSRIDELGGLARVMPTIAGMLLFAALANLGLPALSGFIAEFQAFLGLFLSPSWPIAACGLVGLGISAAYMLRAVLRTTFGPLGAEHAEVSDARPLEVVPMFVLAAAIILIGVYPNVLAVPLQATLYDVLGRIGG